jgi:CRP/FNR family nitrogen fixation transcriptional regulator
MSRRDIADYLGLAIETVSRAFAQLQSRGVIRLLDGPRCMEFRVRQSR